MHKMEGICCEILKNYSDLAKIAIMHRKGWVAVGKPSFIVAVSGGHRCDPHSAVIEIVNQVKAKVPIWKKVIYDQIEESSLIGRTSAFGKDNAIDTSDKLKGSPSSSLEKESVLAQPVTLLNHWSTSSEAFWRKTIG